MSQFSRALASAQHPIEVWAERAPGKARGVLKGCLCPFAALSALNVERAQR